MRSPALPSWSDWVFAIRTSAAAMAALYIGFAFGFDRPYWAMASAYIASQPLAGATRSKAIYRLLGTALGASVTVALVPALSEAPVLLSLALAGWVGACLYLALLDRSPRSYVFMLAGYTAPIIGFPSVSTPELVFTTAVARVQEIGLGIAVASLAASVVLPRPVRPALAARLDQWLGDARAWAFAGLRGEREDEATRRRRQALAGDVGEIDLLASHLAWDPAAPPGAVRTLRALRRRMLMLLPVLSSVADRVRGLQVEGVAPEVAAVAGWLERREEMRAPPALRERLAEPVAGDDWAALLRASLRQRLGELVDLVEDCRRLRWHLDEGGAFPAPLAYARSRGAANVRHVDHGRALWSAAAAALAVMVICVFWIEAAWPEGAVAAEMAAVACSFFAALDDPVPAILRFLWASVAAVVIDAAFLFAVLPQVDSFPLLAGSLAPVFVWFGLLMASPRWSGTGMALAANGATLLSLQSTYQADFASFANSALAFVVGMGSAAALTAIVRSVGAEWSALRLLRRTWRDLATAARRRGQGDRAAFVGLMLDRISLAAPRLAAAGPGSEVGAVDTLSEVRLGLNIATLRRVRRRLPEAALARLDAALDGLAAYFAARARGRTVDGAELLRRVDAALAAMGEAGRRDGALAMVGVRRAVFPGAGAYRPEVS